LWLLSLQKTGMPQKPAINRSRGNLSGDREGRWNWLQSVPSIGTCISCIEHELHCQRDTEANGRTYVLTDKWWTGRVLCVEQASALRYLSVYTCVCASNVRMLLRVGVAHLPALCAHLGSVMGVSYVCGVKSCASRWMRELNGDLRYLGLTAVKLGLYSPQTTSWTPQGMWVLRKCKVSRNKVDLMFVTNQRENIHPSKKKMNKAVTMLTLADVCS
jgi:hypothetical protein